MDPVINSQLQSPLARNLNHIPADSTAFTYHVEQNAPPMSLHKTYVNAQSSRSGFDQTYSFRLPQYGYLSRATLKLTYKIRAVQRCSVTPVLPMYHMVDKVELMSHNNVIETLYGDSMMIKHAYYSTAETAPTKLLGTLNVPPESANHIDIAQLFKSDKNVPFNPFDSSQWNSSSNERTVTFFLELPFSFTDNPAMYLDTRFVEFLDIQVKLSSTKHGLPLFQAAAAVELDMGMPNIQLDPRKHVLGIGSTDKITRVDYANKASTEDQMLLVVPTTADVTDFSATAPTIGNAGAAPPAQNNMGIKVMPVAEKMCVGGGGTLAFYYRPFGTRAVSNNPGLAELSPYTDDFLAYTRGLNTTSLPEDADVGIDGTAIVQSGMPGFFSRSRAGNNGVASGSWAAGWGCDPVELQLGARPRSRLTSRKPLWMDGYYPAANEDGIYACAHAGEPRFIRVGACNFNSTHYTTGYWGLKKGDEPYGVNTAGLSDTSIKNNICQPPGLSGATNTFGTTATEKASMQSDVNVKLNAVNWGLYGGQYKYVGSFSCTGGPIDWDPNDTSATTDELPVADATADTTADFATKKANINKNRKGRMEEAATTADLEDPFLFGAGPVSKTVDGMSNTLAANVSGKCGTNTATAKARSVGAMLNNDCKFGDGRKAGNTCRATTHVNIDTKTAVIERFYAMYPYLNTAFTEGKWTADEFTPNHGKLPADIIVEGSQINAKSNGVPNSTDVALQLMCTFLHLHDKVREEISMANFKDNTPATILMNDTYQEYNGIKYGQESSSYATETDQSMVLPIRSKNLAYAISIVAYRDKTDQQLVGGNVYNAVHTGDSAASSRMDIAMSGANMGQLEGLSKESEQRMPLVGELSQAGAGPVHVPGFRSGKARKEYSTLGASASAASYKLGTTALSTSTRACRWSCDGIGSVDIVPFRITSDYVANSDILDPYAATLLTTAQGCVKITGYGDQVAQTAGDAATCVLPAVGTVNGVGVSANDVGYKISYLDQKFKSGSKTAGGVPDTAYDSTMDYFNAHAIGGVAVTDIAADGATASADPNMGPCICSDPSATWPNYKVVENFKTVKPTYMKLGVAGRTIYETGQGTSQANSYYSTSSSGFVGDRGAGRWMVEKDLDNLPMHYNKSGERGEMASIVKLPNMIAESEYTTSIHDHCDASVITFGLNKTDQLSNNGTLGLSSSTNAQLELKFAEPCRVSVYVHYHATMQIDSNTGVMTRSLDV